MKWNASLSVVVLVACMGESESPRQDAESSGGRHQSGGAGAGSGGKPGAGGSSADGSGGSAGAALSGGRAPNGGAPASGATSAAAGTDASAGNPGAGGAPVATGGATMGGGSGGPAEAGSGGTSVGSGGAGESGAGAGGADTTSAEGAPCDIYASGNTPCAAAYSTVRALFDAYDGPLYQVRRADGETRDIGVLAAGSVANAATQDAFCGTQVCTVSVIYDQSVQGNHLTKAPPGCYEDPAPSNESDANGRALKVGGHDVYALHMISKDGYRANVTSGMPTGSEAQGIYEVLDGTRVGDGCCFDFGNGTTNNCLGSAGYTNALFFGTAYWGTGAGDGPWFMADFERGVWSGGDGASQEQNTELPSSTFDYAFGILKTSSTSYTLRVGNAQSGALTTGYDGAAPVALKMKGGVILGMASDGSDSSYGTFFEGAITNGRPSNAVDDLVLKNVQAAGYGK